MLVGCTAIWDGGLALYALAYEINEGNYYSGRQYKLCKSGTT